jgi:hypothetical protein
MKYIVETDTKIKGCYNCPCLVNNVMGELCVLLDEYKFEITKIPENCPLKEVD